MKVTSKYMKERILKLKMNKNNIEMKGKTTVKNRDKQR